MLDIRARIRMKILFLIDSLGSGGAQRQVVTLSRSLTDRGHDVSILVYAEENFFESQVRENGVRVIKLFATNYVKRICAVRKAIHQGGYNAVISFLDTPNFLNNLSAISRHRKWKVITSERSNKEEMMRSRRGRIFGWFQRYSDALVCNSHNAEAMWLRYYPQYEDKLHTIYNAVEVSHCDTHYIPRRNGKLHLVVAASYQYLKNPIGLIRAVALMDPSVQKQLQVDWYGRLYGSNLEKDLAYQEALGLICKHKLSDIIHLHEPTAEIHSKMKEADFVGLFSQLEGLPNVICEGMSLSKPIIMSRVSDYNILVDDRNGFLCDWDNELSIKDALEKVLQLTTDEILDMGANSYSRAQKLFDLSKVVQQWEHFIESHKQ